MSAGVDVLPDTLTRLKLTAMRDRLDGLLDEAARSSLSLRETLAPLCGAEVAHREERRIQMGMAIAKFPHQRTLEAFDCQSALKRDPRSAPKRDPSGAVPSVRLGARREAGDVEQRRAARRPPLALRNGFSVASCGCRFPRWRSGA